jgi:guanylate kinase
VRHLEPVVGRAPTRTLPVVVITGPSGAGKGTLIRLLLERVPGLRLAVSATTREQRPGEIDGVHYWFKSNEEFDRLVAEGAFLEWVPYVGHRYGTLRSELERIAAKGAVPVLELEIEGAERVETEVPNAVSIFVDAPLVELERRLQERATESSGDIRERVAIAQEQRRHAGRFDHVVQNDRLERAVEEIAAIVERQLAGAGTISRP